MKQHPKGISDFQKYYLLYPRMRSKRNFQSDKNFAKERPNVNTDRTNLILDESKGPISSPKLTSNLHLSYDQGTEITNYYDREEVNKVITSQTSSQKRLEIIDLVIKRRKQIKEAEDQVKFERAVPILLKLSKNLQKRVVKNKLNIKSNQFQKLVANVDPKRLSIIQEGENVSSPILKLDKYSYCSPRLNKDDQSDSSPSEIKHTTLTSFLKEIGSLNSLNSVESPDTDQKSITVMRDINKVKQMTLLFGKMKPVQNEPKALVFDENENKKDVESLAKFIPNQSHKLNKDQEESRSPGNRKKILDTKLYQLAAKELEENLYTYLIKNDQKLGECSVITKLSGLKEVRMKNIETRVCEQFNIHQLRKKQFINSTPRTRHIITPQPQRSEKVLVPCLGLSNSVTNERSILKPISIGASPKDELRSTRMHKSPVERINTLDSPKVRSLTSDRKRPTLISFNEYGSPVINSLKKLNRTTRDRRCDKQEEIDDVIETLNLLNDSLVSYTESKLDRLYRQSRKLRGNLANINNVLEDLDDKLKLKKMKELKDKKQADLERNIEETLRTIRRKVAN